MKFRALAISLMFIGAGLVGPGAGISSASNQQSVSAVAHHACTRTSSGKCIRGGQFCPQAKYRKSGWDAKGRRYVCKGNRTHPHWMKP